MKLLTLICTVLTISCVLSCSVDLTTTSVSYLTPATNYEMLLSIGSATACSFTCSITGGGAAAIQGVASGSYTVSMKTYYYFEFPGLTLGTPYTYTCSDSIKRRNLANAEGKAMQATATGNFVFPRNNQGTVKILAFGDWSDSVTASSNANYTTTASANSYGVTTLNWLNTNRQNYYDAFLFAGDMAYDLHVLEYFNGGQSTFNDTGNWGNKWMTQANSFLANQPLFYSPGNHEAQEVGWYNLNRFFMPNNSNTKNQYFSVDVGPVHMVSINSNIFSNFSSTNQSPTLTAATTAWLKADLAASNQPWKVITFHQPLYCSPASSSHCGGTAAYTANLLESILQTGKIDLVLNGHVHDYERFAPMNKGVPDYSSASNGNHTFTHPKYPIYISCGSPGNNEGLGSKSSMQPQITGSLFAFGSETGAGICDFSANSTVLSYQATGTSGSNAGKQIDYVTIVKQ